MFGSVRLCVIGLCLLLGTGCGSDEPFSGFFNVSWGIYDIDYRRSRSLVIPFGFDTAVVRSYNVDSAPLNKHRNEIRSYLIAMLIQGSTIYPV